MRPTHVPILVSIACIACAGAAPTPGGPGHGLVQLRVRDADTGAPLSARIELVREGASILNDEVGPTEGSLEWRLRHEGATSVYVAEDSVLRVPVGRSTLRVSRGPRTRTVVRELDVDAMGTTVEIELEERRGPEGWHCGDLRVHAARFDDTRDDALVALLDTEGLELAGLADWAGRARERTDERWSWRARELRPFTHAPVAFVPVQAWGPSDSASVLLLAGHRTPVAGRNPIARAAIVEAVTGEGGLVASASGQLFVEAALLDRLVAVELDGNPDDLRAWYDVLDVGARVAAIAGSGVELGAPTTLQSPPGTRRTCARASDAEQVLSAVAGGRTYATTGPDLELEVEGAWIGATLDRAAPGTLRAQLALRDLDAPGGRLELVRNGEVVWARPADQAEIEARVAVEMPSAGWIALRLRAPDAFAHTSPVYVRMQSVPHRAADARARLAAAIPSDAAIADTDATDGEREVALRWARAARRALEAMH